MLEAETPGYLTCCVRAFQLDQAHGWMDMDTDTGRVASVMQIPPPPGRGPTSRACLKTTEAPDAAKNDAEQKIEPGTGTGTRPPTASHAWQKGKTSVEMGWSARSGAWWSRWGRK